MQFHGVPLIEFLGIPEMEDQLAKHGPHGGARVGAGRKPNPDGKMVVTAFVITQQQVAWLEDQTINTGESKSAVVRSALDLLMKKRRPTVRNAR